MLDHSYKNIKLRFIGRKNPLAPVPTSKKHEEAKLLLESEGEKESSGYGRRWNKRCPSMSYIPLVKSSFVLILLFQALTAADVGIAMGSGSDIALSSADFVLLSSNLHTLLILTGLSRKVLRRVKFNFVSFHSVCTFCFI